MYVCMLPPLLARSTGPCLTPQTQSTRRTGITAHKESKKKKEVKKGREIHTAHQCVAKCMRAPRARVGAGRAEHAMTPSMLRLVTVAAARAGRRSARGGVGGVGCQPGGWPSHSVLAPRYAVGRKAVPAAVVDVERVEGVHHTTAGFLYSFLYSFCDSLSSELGWTRSCARALSWL
jgi:hypothetical protein